MKCRNCQIELTRPHNTYYYSVECRNRYYWYRRNGGVGIKCEICGRHYKRVGRHVFNTHKMTAREYRKEYGFDVKKGQLLPEDRDIMREHTKSNGTIGNLKNGKVYWFKKGDHRAGRYERSEQTLNRLKEQIKRGRQRKTMEADSQGVSQKTSP